MSRACFPNVSQFPIRETLFPVSVFCFQDSNYAYATRQGILTKMRACEQLQKFCEHEQASTLLFFASNRPFPSSLVPLFQSESKCETILMKMTFICMNKKLRAELIFIWKVLHLDSLWNRGTRELGNGLFEQRPNFASTFKLDGTIQYS